MSDAPVLIDCWAYLERLEDYSVYEDQLAEHTLAGHRAVKRVFAEAMAEDGAAMEAVRRQARAATQSMLPYVPAVLDEGLQHGALYHIIEWAPGESLEVIARREDVRRPSRWGRLALLLFRMGKELRLANIDFRALRLADIHMQDGVLRVGHRRPLPFLSTAEMAQSPFLKRIHENTQGGVFTSEGPYAIRESYERLIDLLYFLALGHSEKGFSATLAGGERLQIEVEIEGILRRMLENRSADPFLELGGVEEDLHRLARVAPAAAPDQRTSRATPVLAQEKPIPAAAEKPDSGSSRTVPMAQLGAEKIGGASALDNEEEELEDRRFLYPTRRSTTTGAVLKIDDDEPEPAKGSAAEQVVKKKTKHIKEARKIRTGGGLPKPAVYALIGLGVLLLLGGLVAGGIALWSMIEARSNKPPMAQIQGATDAAQVRELIALDGGASTDPDEDPLTYSWDVEGLGNTDYRFSRNGTPQAAQTELQVFRTGTFTVHLRVFDGRVYSEPASQTITITSVR